MLRILKLDRTGHTTIEENIEQEFSELCRKGYAMFLNDEHIKTLPIDHENLEGDLIALAPLVGG